MKDVLKNHGLIIAAFLLPLLLIAGVTLSTVGPKTIVNTEYDFVYAVCSNNPYNYKCSDLLQNYGVDGESIVVTATSTGSASDFDVRLFVHDTEADTSREITREEAEALALDGKITSPDGVAVEWDRRGGSGDFIFFDSRTRYGYYLTKGDASTKLNLVYDDDNYYYRGNMKFIGWVIEQ